MKNLNEIRKIVRQVLVKESILKEGATIGINGLFEDKKDLTNILNICHAFQEIAYPIHKVKYDSFSPDGNDAFEKTGIVNFYLKNEFTNGDKNDLISIMRAIQKFSKENGLTLSKITAETSGAQNTDIYDNDSPKTGVKNYQAGEPLENIRVIRIPVIKNESFDTGLSQHEIHLGYSTVKTIFGNVLGFPIASDDYSFTFPAKEVKERIENMTSERESVLYQRDIPLSYLNIIHNMAKYAVDHGYKTLGGA